MIKNAVGIKAALALGVLLALAPVRAGIDDGLLEARIASFENGTGAAVTFRNFDALFHGAGGCGA
jgi:hypothetical protein